MLESEKLILKSCHGFLTTNVDFLTITNKPFSF